MKTGVLAVAAAIASGANAIHAAHRHAHQALHLGRDLMATGSPADETCGCTTIYTTIYGAATLINNPPPAAATTSVVPSVSVAEIPPPAAATTSAVPSVSVAEIPPPVISTKTPAIPVPTPAVVVVPTPGTYTIPATTVTISETTTVCGAATTSVPAGNCTYGGVTTIVKTATTVICPVATVKTNEGVVTSTIELTTYVCPSAGTYTIAPSTSSVSVATVIVFPTPAVFTPGTYTRDSITTTIVETDYVIFCPLTAAQKTTSTVPAPVAPTSSPAQVQVASAPAVQVTPIAPAPVSVSSKVPVVVASPPASPSASPSAKSPSLGSAGNQWAITYTPYTSSGQCKSASDVANDIQIIKKAGFTTVRVYSTDCSGLANIGSACQTYGIRMIIGIFISSSGISGAQDQVTAIMSWNKLSIVDLIVVGNEAVFNGFCTASALATFIAQCKSKFSTIGYSGPVTTTEPLNIWQANAGALCGVVDVVGANIHPFFNAGVEAANAGPFVASQLKIVDSLCPGKTGVNLESGWPSAGSCNGKACPGASQQAIALKSITETVGSKTVIFSFVNDPWKPVGEFGCEQSWGAVHLY